MKSFLLGANPVLLVTVLFCYPTACSAGDDIAGTYIQRCGNNKIVLTSDHVCKAYFEVFDQSGNINPELVKQDVQKLSQEGCDRRSASKTRDVSFQINDDNDEELSTTVQGEKFIIKQSVAFVPGPLLIRNVSNKGESHQYFLITAVRAFHLLWRVQDQNIIECYAIARSDSGKERQDGFIILQKDGDNLKLLGYLENRAKGLINTDDRFVKLK